MIEPDLHGQRVLVIGASAGIGRSLAQYAARCGAQVVFCARRRERLERAAAEVQGGHVVVGDVRRPEDCERIVRETVQRLGGIDLLVYSTATAPLAMMDGQTPEGWRELFETNALGAFLTANAAIPHLSDHGAIAYLSSVGVGAPYFGAKTYTVTKAALDEGMSALRLENPGIRVVQIKIGDTMGTETAIGHDPELTRKVVPDMRRYGMILDQYLDVDTVGPMLVEQLAIVLKHPDAWIETVTIRPVGTPIAAETGGGDEEIASMIQESFGNDLPDG